MPIVNVRSKRGVSSETLWALREDLQRIVAEALETSSMKVDPDAVALEFDEGGMDKGRDFRILVLANVNSERVRNLDERAWLIKMRVRKIIGHDKSLVVYIHLAEGGVSVSSDDDQ